MSIITEKSNSLKDVLEESYQCVGRNIRFARPMENSLQRKLHKFVVGEELEGAPCKILQTRHRHGIPKVAVLGGVRHVNAYMG